jgi:hypothetical protein
MNQTGELILSVACSKSAAVAFGERHRAVFGGPGGHTLEVVK